MGDAGAGRRGATPACAVCATSAVFAVACGRSERSTSDAAPASTPRDAAATARADDASSPRPHWGDAVRAAAHLPCRAVAVDGLVRAEDVAQPGAAHVRPGADGGAGLALVLQQDIPTESWLTLGPSSRLVAKDPRTTRETTFLGAGRVRPCVDRREESWVATGAFESVVGAGESPGSEEWVVTPLAVLRYASAKLHVAVGPKGTSITPSAGLTFAWLADDAHARWGGDAGAGAEGPSSASDAGSGSGGAAKATAADGWERVADAPLILEPTAGVPVVQAAGASVARCAALADHSHELATLLMAPTVGLPDASAAAEQVIARRQARAACAVAALRVGALAEAPAKDALAAKLAESVAVWTALPSP